MTITLIIITPILAQAEDAANTGIPIWKFAIPAAVAMFAFFMLMSTRKRIARGQRKMGMPVRQRIKEQVGHNQIYSQIGELMAELADLSRQINGQIDTRLAKLEILLDQADQTIALLENAASQTNHPADSTAAEDAQQLIQNLRQQIQNPTPAKKKDNPKPNPITEKPENRKIIELAQSGQTPLQIAQKLNRPIGEIELILSLGKTNNP